MSNIIPRKSCRETDWRSVSLAFAYCTPFVEGLNTGVRSAQAIDADVMEAFENESSLRGKFGSLTSGSKQPIPSFVPWASVPYFEKDKVLASWNQRADKFDLNPTLRAMEKNFGAKFGPQGHIKPFWKTVSGLQAYYPNKLETKSIWANLKGLKRKAKKFAEIMRGRMKDNCDPIDLKSVLQRLIDRKQDTRTGWPHYGRKDEVELQVFAVRSAEELIADILAGGSLPQYWPYFLGARNQKQSDRFIFEEPFREGLVAGMFTVPLLQGLRSIQGLSFNPFSGWDGPEQHGVNLNQERLANAKAWPDAIHFMSDFAKMDTTVREEHVEIVREFIVNFMRIPTTLLPVLDWSLRGMVFAPLLIPGIEKTADIKIIPPQDHSAFSGSSWIQLVETILGGIMAFDFLEETGSFLDAESGVVVENLYFRSYDIFLSVLGDDSRWSLYGFPPRSVEERGGRRIFFKNAVVDCLEMDGDIEPLATLIKRIPLPGVTSGKWELRVTQGTILELWVDYAASLGLVCHPEKQELTDSNTNFCKHWTLKSSKARKAKTRKDVPDNSENTLDWALPQIYPAVLALNSVVNPEKLSRNWTKEKDFCRIVQILDGVCDHPLFHMLIEFVAAGTADSLGRWYGPNKPYLNKSEFADWLSVCQTQYGDVPQRDIGWYTVNGMDRIDLNSSPTVRYLASTLKSAKTTIEPGVSALDSLLQRSGLLN